MSRSLGGLFPRLVRFAVIVAISLAALTLLRAVIVDEYLVPTGSMHPTIRPGDRIVVYKAAYSVRVPFLSDDPLFTFDDPEAGDVVLFVDPRGGPIPLVKRVVALEGQTVMLEAGRLFIDGKAAPLGVEGGRLRERLNGRVHDVGARDFDRFGPEYVPLGHVFVLGDDRLVSLDSRELGPIPKRLLRGRVLPVSLHFGSEPKGEPVAMLRAH